MDATKCTNDTMNNGGGGRYAPSVSTYSTDIRPHAAAAAAADAAAA